MRRYVWMAVGLVLLLCNACGPVEGFQEAELAARRKVQSRVADAGVLPGEDEEEPPPECRVEGGGHCVMDPPNCVCNTPLCLSLVPGGTVNVSHARDGVLFDITGKGRLAQVAWPVGDTALLVMDRNNNGLIDDGKELFGNQHGLANGFAQLSLLDTNGDRVLNRKDAAFSRLRVWQDANRDGVSQATELQKLGAVGVKSLGLTAVSSTRRDLHGNGFFLQSIVRFAKGGTSPLVDVWLTQAPAPNM